MGTTWARSRGEQQGIGGHGYAQVDVVALDDKALFSVRSWGFSSRHRPLDPQRLRGAARDDPRMVDDPKPLKAIQPSNTPSLLILPMPYKIDDKTYDTVRFQTTTANGSVGWNYDLATGILVHSHTAATTA